MGTNKLIKLKCLDVTAGTGIVDAYVNPGFVCIISAARGFDSDFKADLAKTGVDLDTLSEVSFYDGRSVLAVGTPLSVKDALGL